MKADIKKNEQVRGEVIITITCTKEEMILMGEGLQMALDNRLQNFGTYLIKAQTKIQ